MKNNFRLLKRNFENIILQKIIAKKKIRQYFFIKKWGIIYHIKYIGKYDYFDLFIIKLLLIIFFILIYVFVPI